MYEQLSMYPCVIYTRDVALIYRQWERKQTYDRPNFREESTQQNS